jgi:hypothetical protein
MPYLPPSIIGQGAAADIRLPDSQEHAYCLNAWEAVKRYRETSRLSWRDWTKVIGPALLMCRKTAKERMGRFGRRYEDHMGALVDFYGLEDVRGNDRAALLYIMEHLDEVNAWRDLQPDRDNLNNPQVAYREFMKKSAHGWLHAKESRDTILCKWVVRLAETVQADLAEIERLNRELEWEQAAPTQQSAVRPVQSSVYRISPEVEDILQKITQDSYGNIIRSRAKKTEHVRGFLRKRTNQQDDD